MICKKCGAQLSDGAKFCNSCGVSLTSVGDTPSNNSTLRINDKSAVSVNSILDFIKKNKFIVGVGFVVLLICIFCGGRSAEETALQYVEATLEGDAKTATQLTCDITIEESNYPTRKLYAHALEESLKKTRERYENKYGDKWKYKIKIIDSYDVDFSEIEAYVEIDEFVSSHMKEVMISVEHKGSGWLNDKEGTEDLIITCVKLGRKWYVLYFE